VTESFLAARYAVPPRPEGYVDRPRLAELLDRGARGPVTLVSSPAGTGKTVSVASWATSGRPPGPVVWISFDDADVAATTLWPFVVEGIRRRGVRLGSPAPSTGHGELDTGFLSTLTAQIAALPEPVVLVLDCDAALPKDAASGLDHVLRRVGDRLRLVLLTRADPLLPLPKYRLSGSLVEIRMADLAFTTPEATALLAGKGVHLPESTTDVLARRTQGWAAGLILTAMSLAHRVDPQQAAADFTGATGPVAEYLLTEVLDVQTPDARELLLSTSVVDRLRPGLVEALAGARAPRALEFLSHGNAFLEAIPESAGCYRYHTLFRDLLRAQLWYEAPEKARQLRRRAARWLAEHDELVEAVRQAGAADAWEDSAQYVVDDLAIAQLVVEPPRSPLGAALGRMPDEAAGPCVSLVRAARALSRNDVERCAGELTEARRLLERSGSPASPAAELAASLLLMASARARGDSEATLAASAQVERLLTAVDSSRRLAHPEIAALVGVSRGFALVSSGWLEEAADAFRTGASAPHRPGSECPLIDCLGHLALLAAWSGQLRKATALAAQATTVESESDVPPDTCSSAAETALAWVHSEAYGMTRAKAHLRRASAMAPPHDDPLQRAALAIVDARIRRASRDFEGALARLAEAQAGPGLPPWLADRLRAEEAGLDIGSGEPELAVELLAATAEPSGPEAVLALAEAKLASGEDLKEPVPTIPGAQGGTLSTRVDGWLLEAWRRLRQGDEPSAARALDRSLRLAAPERLRRPFREAPREVRRLFRRHEELARQHGWVGIDRPLTVAEIPEQRTAAPTGSESAVLLIEPLTEKEREVLGHLADLLTTEEIAAAMFVSVNTVRTHVRNILRKMSASRRNEAVRRARELGIISGPGTAVQATHR
jgi:LuxR family maltose regulon positive regulatory protein